MSIIVGIDEVGRGPLAGRVTVCMVVCEESLYKKLKRNKNLPKIGLDSKKLSVEERKRASKCLFDIRNQVSKTVFDMAVAHISNKQIDKRGISVCVKKVIERCIRKLKLSPKQCVMLLDGGLKAPTEFKNQKTIIKGDEKEKIIAWASILAKVRRDALMTRLAKKFPQYGFEFHKGYATSSHRSAIRTNGLSVFHRKSFCKNFTFGKV